MKTGFPGFNDLLMARLAGRTRVGHWLDLVLICSAVPLVYLLVISGQNS